MKGICNKKSYLQESKPRIKMSTNILLSFTARTLTPTNINDTTTNMFFFAYYIMLIFHENLETGGLGFMVFNATFNNISVISWGSVLLMEKTGVPGENCPPVVSH